MMFTDARNNVDVDDSTRNKLIPKVTISDNTGEVFCCKFSPCGQFLAAGGGDGAIRVFNAHNGVMSYNLQGRGQGVGVGVNVQLFMHTLLISAK